MAVAPFYLAAPAGAGQAGSARLLTEMPLPAVAELPLYLTDSAAPSHCHTRCIGWSKRSKFLALATSDRLRHPMPAAISMPSAAPAGVARRLERRQGDNPGGGGATLWRRQQHGSRHRRAAAASLGMEPSLVTLPVFPLPTVLHPTQQGVLTGVRLLPHNCGGGCSGKCGRALRGACQVPAASAPKPPPRPPAPSTPPSAPAAVFEPRYLGMFGAMLREQPGGKGSRFVHALNPAAAPPALLESAVGGLPRIACCAEVQAIEVRAWPA